MNLRAATLSLLKVSLKSWVLSRKEEGLAPSTFSFDNDKKQTKPQWVTRHRVNHSIKESSLIPTF